MGKNFGRRKTIRSTNLRTTRGKRVRLRALLDDRVERSRWDQAMADPSIPKVLDLFCGAGGLSAGFLAAGFAVVAAIDHDPDVVETFAANIPARTLCSEVRQVDRPTTILEETGVDQPDVVVGGPPCQGFSMAGRSRIRSLDNSAQVRLLTRNELYGDFFRFVEAFEPLFFMLENVPGLLSFAGGVYMEAIEAESARLGYAVETAVLDAVDHGVPQFRRRLFVVGSRVGRLFRWPRVLLQPDRVTLLDAIGDLPFTKAPTLKEQRPYQMPDRPTLYQRLMRSRVPVEERDVIMDHVVRPVRDDDRIIFMHMKPGDRYTDVPPEYRRYDSSKFKDKYYKLKPDEPGNTITAHIAKDGYRYIHWDAQQNRTLSVREAARIQSFGDHYRFAGWRSSRFRMIGNAVPPLLAQELATQLRRALSRASDEILQQTGMWTSEARLQTPIEVETLD